MSPISPQLFADEYHAIGRFTVDVKPISMSVTASVSSCECTEVTLLNGVALPPQPRVAAARRIHHVGMHAVRHALAVEREGAVIGAEDHARRAARGLLDGDAVRKVDHVDRVDAAVGGERRLRQLAGVDLRRQLGLDLRVGHRGRQDARRDGVHAAEGAVADALVRAGQPVAGALEPDGVVLGQPVEVGARGDRRVEAAEARLQRGVHARAPVDLDDDHVLDHLAAVIAQGAGGLRLRRRPASARHRRRRRAAAHGGDGWSVRRVEGGGEKREHNESGLFAQTTFLRNAPFDRVAEDAPATHRTGFPQSCLRRVVRETPDICRKVSDILGGSPSRKPCIATIAA